MSLRFLKSSSGAALLAGLLWAAPASADLVVSQLIVELWPDQRTADVEILNDSEERAYVAIEPAEIINPGRADEKRVAKPNPKELGLLVSSNRLVLEPGQRRMLRIGSIGPASTQERVYRVAVKPVSGEITSNATGLKVLVGYDMLVMVKPAELSDVSIDGARAGDTLTLSNKSNSSVELSDGQLCRTEKDCEPLPGKRIYAGASWSQKLPRQGTVKYRARSGQRWVTLTF